jgi:nitric oxide reductase NorD protein
MDLDEIIFEKVAKYFYRKNKNAIVNATNNVALDDIRTRLLIMARALTGLPIKIYGAEREGGYKDNNFFLPVRFATFKTAEENLSFYFYRILYLSIQQKLGLNWSSDDFADSTLAAQKAKDNAPIVLSKLAEEYPICIELHDEFKQQLIMLHKDPKTTVDLTWLYGKWMKNRDKINTTSPLENFSEKVKTTLLGETTTTLKAKAMEEIRSVAIDKKQQEDYVLTHNFEKVETAEEFDGVWRDFDGDDDLEKHQDAIEELNLKLTVRVDDAAHSIYQAEFIENSTVAESGQKERGGHYISYPEWDYNKKQYRENFCKVFPLHEVNTNIDYYQNTINNNRGLLIGLRKMVTSLNNKLSQQKRQTEGQEFDLDALTDFYTDVHCKRTPSDKIFLSNRKKEKDISILLLLDSSLSSDGYVDGNKVIDVEKQVAILFGEIMEEHNIDFSVASFFSKTRNYLGYQVIKNFDENWQTAKNKIGAIEPTGYTRIGGALRHAGCEMQKRKTKNKWVILLSDGKPNDYDRYEGKHGINDVKQALRELNEYNINSYALAIEVKARYYLPLMFGQNHYQILPNTNELLKSMIVLFEKIKYQ